jgi:hypothetical protein
MLETTLAAIAVGAILYAISNMASWIVLARTWSLHEFGFEFSASFKACKFQSTGCWYWMQIRSSRSGNQQPSRCMKVPC